MADQPFNVAKGRAVQFYHNVEDDAPTGCELVVLLLKVTEADATLIDYDTVSALLAGSNTEADFTNYARKILVAADLATPSPDDTNNRYDIDIPDQTWTAAGGTTDNTLVKLVFAYDPLGTGVDTNLIPISHHDFSITTNGGDITAQVDAAGIFRAE